MAHWLDNAIFYEIYPQSFQDTNSDGIGDFQGIFRRLDYIQDLGCNAIWLNPCFDSPFTDAGYDISDYYKVAPRYGTNDDLAQLFAAVHARGMHMLLDLVPGHTSIDHPWFKQSMLPEQNEYSGRYVWTDQAFSSEAEQDDPQIRGWLRGISGRNGACAVNFFATQPALNYGFSERTRSWQQPVDSADALATRAAMKGVMRFWLKMGCDGFRVDMAFSLVKNDPERRETIRLWQDFRQFLDQEFPDAVMISEWGDPQQSLSGGFHMDFLLHFGESHYNDLFRDAHPYFCADGQGKITLFIETYQRHQHNTDGKGLICIPSGNHDMERLSFQCDTDEMKLAFAFLLTMPGAPFIYYGDEIGMRYLKDTPSVEGGYYRTGSRSPMQWDDGLNAGFSNGSVETLYIPLDADADRPTVQRQAADPDSLLNFVKRLIRIRKEHAALQTLAPVEFMLTPRQEYPLVYTRQGGDERLVVAINPTGKALKFPLVGEVDSVLLDYAPLPRQDSAANVLPPLSVKILRLV